MGITQPPPEAGQGIWPIAAPQETSDWIPQKCTGFIALCFVVLVLYIHVINIFSSLRHWHRKIVWIPQRVKQSSITCLKCCVLRAWLIHVKCIPVPWSLLHWHQHQWSKHDLCDLNQYQSNATKHKPCAQFMGCTVPSGPCLNVKTVVPKYGDSHVKNKTVSRPSYLYHGDPYAGKTASLYWDGPQGFYSLYDKTSYIQISWIHQAMRLGVLIILSTMI